MQTTSQSQTAGVRVLQNGSQMSDRQVEHKVREHAWDPGIHLILIQDRYGDGPFFYDWKKVEERPETITRDWNVAVEVR